MSSKLKVIVAVHKPYDVRRDDTFLPVHAGRAQSAADYGYQSDAQGEQISAKNPLYCELTTLYWAWKNLEANALGLMHYRRYLAMPGRFFPWVAKEKQIASGEELRAMLEKTPVLMPKKRDRAGM